ncbi:hypothetical protein KGY73_00385 [bacterium]|nr:hypothetical protein [bacterium]
MIEESKDKREKEIKEDVSRLIESIRKENDMLRKMIDSFKKLEQQQDKKTEENKGGL